jgi:hypothetical protein
MLAKVLTDWSTNWTILSFWQIPRLTDWFCYAGHETITGLMVASF